MATGPDLSAEIKKVLKHLCKTEGHELTSDGQWTEAVKRELCILGKDKGHHVYASGVDDTIVNGGEFLFDVCWLRYGSNDKCLKNAELVVECEWGDDGEIDDDFQKLMLARADFRLMIFGGNNECTKKTLKMLKEELVSYSANGSRCSSDVYLVAAYESDGRFSFHKLTGSGNRVNW